VSTGSVAGAEAGGLGVHNKRSMGGAGVKGAPGLPISAQLADAAVRLLVLLQGSGAAAERR
jgi:hypothetical protein